MSELSVAVQAAAEAKGVRATPCGLNADWNCSAWCLGSVEPNMTDGAFYLLDDEEMGTISLVRRFYLPEELDGYEPNPYDDACYEDEGMNDEVRPCRSAPQTQEGAAELIDEFVKFVAWCEKGGPKRRIGVQLDLDQNVFGVIGLVSRALKDFGESERAKEWRDRAMSEKYDHPQLIKFVLPQYVTVIP